MARLTKGTSCHKNCRAELCSPLLDSRESHDTPEHPCSAQQAWGVTLHNTIRCEECQKRDWLYATAATEGAEQCADSEITEQACASEGTCTMIAHSHEAGLTCPGSLTLHTRGYICVVKHTAPPKQLVGRVEHVHTPGRDQASVQLETLVLKSAWNTFWW